MSLAVGTETYRALLVAPASGDLGEELNRAYQWGRSALERGVSLLDILAVHTSSIAALLGADAATPVTSAEIARIAAITQEVVAPFEMAYRGYKDANQALISANENLEATIAERTDELTRLNKHLTQQLAVKDGFVAAVSHELRTPLTSVLGFAEALDIQWDGLDEDDRRSLLGTVVDQARELSMLVEDLLVAARIDRDSLHIIQEPVSVATLVAKLTSTFDEKLSTRIEWEPGLSVVMADPLRVRQIIRNLVLNALRHGGPRIRVSATNTDARVTIEVADNGAPIPDDERELIFESFFASQRVQGLAPSVGLGLAISRRLAEMMGGELTYRHSEGWGTFALTLPKAPEETIPPDGGV
jgi:signal transduction histidine kinase